MKYAQLVMGPAGSGKSTYCNTIYNHCVNVKRHVMVVNLDPAAEQFAYPATVDVRELISVDDVLDDEELVLGPNGALVFCMEYLVQNLDWLHDNLCEGEDDYFVFDLPGQIELYSHLPVMRQLVDALRSWDFNVCSVFLIDTHFVLEAEKFMAGALTAMSSMVALETPAVNVLSKMDLLSERNKVLVEEFLETDTRAIVDMDENLWNQKHRKLTRAIASLIIETISIKENKKCEVYLRIRGIEWTHLTTIQSNKEIPKGGDCLLFSDDYASILKTLQLKVDVEQQIFAAGIAWNGEDVEASPVTIRGQIILFNVDDSSKMLLLGIGIRLMKHQILLPSLQSCEAQTATVRQRNAGIQTKRLKLRDREVQSEVEEEVYNDNYNDSDKDEQQVEKPFSQRENEKIDQSTETSFRPLLAREQMESIVRGVLEKRLDAMRTMKEDNFSRTTERRQHCVAETSPKAYDARPPGFNVIPRFEAVRKLNGMIADRKKTLKDLQKDYLSVDSGRGTVAGSGNREQRRPSPRGRPSESHSRPRPILSPTGLSSRKQPKLEENLEKRVERLARILKEKRAEKVEEREGSKEIKLVRRPEKHVVFAEPLQEDVSDEEETTSSSSTAGTESSGTSSSSSGTSSTSASTSSDTSDASSRSEREKNNENRKHSESKETVLSPTSQYINNVRRKVFNDLIENK